jgi:osmotically-inducible protein OsmY
MKPLAPLVVLIALGCSRVENHAGSTHTTSAPAPAKTGPSIVEPSATTGGGRQGVSEDRDVAEMVRMRILADPALEDAVSNVEISVLGHTATLRGTVATQEQKGRVEQATRTLSNIHDVDNELEVRKQP